jgi:protein involved in polysaccharide export with SLBB domain
MMIMHLSRRGLLLLGLVMAGCESGANLGPVSPAEQQALIESAATTSPTLHPGEKIRVIVFGEDRLSGEYEIDPAGFVSLPLAGTIKAAGLSKQQLERDLSKKFSGEYLRNPRVTIDVTSFRPFYILGEVTKAGEYSFKSGLNVMSAIAIAGGTTYRANRSTVLIQHIGENGFREYPLSPTIPVSPGDLIRVPERYF